MTITRVHSALAAAFLATLALGSLAACTPIAPRPTVEQKCTPSSAKITWGTPKQGEKKPVEAHLLSYDHAVEISTPVPTDTDTTATFSFAGDEALSDISTTAEAAWEKSLLARVRATKSVPSGFGNGAAAQPADSHPSRHVGKYLVVTEEELTIVPFTITCTSESSLSGSIAAVADTGSFGTITQCGTTPKGVPAEVIGLMGPACTKE